MSTLPSCSSCDDLRTYAPDFVLNGFDDDNCTSMQNDTGLVPSNGHTDCEDLHDMNDCLVGNMASEVDAYDVCDWKKFAKQFIPNLWTVLKGIICAICGIWINIHELWNKLNLVSYVGILTLYRTSTLTDTSSYAEGSPQILPFSAGAEKLEGNIAGLGILTPTSDYKGIVVSNTTSAPILVDCSFNCSIRTKQHFASCYIVVTRDGITVGQTPFITPNTYDQQVKAESFILNPGETTTMSYYFAIGNANGREWFKDLFYGSSSGDAHMCLEWNDPSNIENQGSYFKVKISSIVSVL